MTFLVAFFPTFHLPHLFQTQHWQHYPVFVGLYIHCFIIQVYLKHRIGCKFGLIHESVNRDGGHGTDKYLVRVETIWLLPVVVGMAYISHGYAPSLTERDICFPE